MKDKIVSCFDKIVEPVLPLLKEEAAKMANDAATYKLSFYFFTLNLLYGAIKQIKSIALLITDIKTSADAKALGLVLASRSMYSEAFGRYDPEILRRIFYRLLDRLNFMEIPEIQTLGRFLCIDGSIFPAFQTMVWARYKDSVNGLKLHLTFELNRMIPLHFICTDANSSEKNALLAMLESGVTYIADRGYISFALFRNISKADAFFVMRIKAGMKYVNEEVLSCDLPQKWQAYISQVTDCRIKFINDKHQDVYRLVTFVAMGETYFIATNRLDLKTHQIIMLYAYRWQIELFFRCIKRTFNALHLWSHSEKGIEVHFYIYLITYILILSFKQQCEAEKNKAYSQADDSDSIHDAKQDSHSPDAINRQSLPQSRIPHDCGIVSLLGGRLKKFWKIGIHWLTALRNLLFEPFTIDSIKLLP